MNKPSINHKLQNPQSLLKPQSTTTSKIQIYFHTNSKIHKLSLDPYFTVSSTILQSLNQLNQILTPHLSLNPLDYQLYVARKDKSRNQDLPSFSHDQVIAKTQIKRFYLHAIDKNGPLSPVQTKNSSNSIQSEIYLYGEDKKGKLLRKKKEVIDKKDIKNERKLSFCSIFCCRK